MSVTKKRKADSRSSGSDQGDSSPETTYVNGPLEVQGSVTAKQFIQFSDIRLKTNITDIVDALKIVTSLEGKMYHWKTSALPEEQSGGQKVIGLIAQEVRKVVPEV